MKVLDKKCISLLHQIELKDIQIKSQEQMLNRRNLEINDLATRLQNVKVVESAEEINRKIINLEVMIKFNNKIIE